MTEWLLAAAAVFAVFVILDLIWAEYTIALSELRYEAALWAAVIPALSGFATIKYVEDWTMLFPVAIGGAVGTAWAIRRARERRKK